MKHDMEHLIYICEKCKFLFSKDKKPETCPDCGKEAVRKANKKEQDEFKKYRKEFN